MVDTFSIKKLANIRTVLSAYGIQANRMGFINCINPDHVDRNASMKVYDRDNSVHCFSCGADYDAIDVVQQLDHCNFRDAARRVSAICGLPFGEDLSPKEKAELKRRRQAIEEERRKREAEQAIKDRQWNQACAELRELEREYWSIVPARNTPQYQTFLNSDKIDQAMAIGIKIREKNAELDNLRAQW